MRQSIVFLFLVNAILINAKSLSNELINPCTLDGLNSLQYYYSYPNDDTRYIECDPWGQMHVKLCPDGAKWNSWISSCMSSSSLPVSDKPSDFATNNETESCSLYGNWTCKNGGYCNQFIEESMCFCLENYTGDFCEIYSPSKSPFNQFINDTFSLELYRMQRPFSTGLLAFNTTIDVTLISDELTRQRVQEYLNKYPHGEMRFDTLVNYFAQDVLEQLYPSAFYLKEFMLPSEIALGYSNAISNLLLSAKYSFDNFDNFFKIFVQVLDGLVEYLSIHMPHVQKEAQSFLKIYNVVYTKFGTIGNFSNFTGQMVNRTGLSRDELRKTIYGDFNATLCLSHKMFKCLNTFDDELSVKGINFTEEQMQQEINKFTSNFTEILTKINSISTSIWDSMSFYGFWHIVSSLVYPRGNTPSVKVPFVMDDMWLILEEYLMKQNQLEVDRMIRFQRNVFDEPHTEPMFNIMPSLAIGKK